MATYLINFFFHHKSYLHYDRKIYCAAAILLASKITECLLNLQKITGAFLQVIKTENQIIDENLIINYKQKVN